MRQIWVIAARELRQYFTTWTAYIVSAIVLFMDGVLFQALALGTGARLSSSVLESFFYFSSGVAMVAGVLLSARLIAEEKQAKTAVLLFSSPVSERQIVYGKFLSAAMFFAFLLLVSLYLPALIFVNGKVSLAHIATGYLGVFLVGASVLSIGVFASALSPNQWIATIIGTLITITFLVLWMLSDVVGEPYKGLFAYLAIHNLHFQGFKLGILRLADVVFYVSFIFFFLECATKAIASRNWRS